MCFLLTFSCCVDSHIHCPHCKAGFDVDWITEYGEPLIGEHEATCLKCNKQFNFSVYNQYNSW